MASTPSERGFSRDAVARTRVTATRSAQQGEPDRAGLALSVVVPTRDEAGNVEALLERLERVLRNVCSEVIFVDDSDDDTPKVVDAIVRAQPPREGLEIVLLHRPRGEREGGLGGAVVAGLRIARAPWVCVMDADLQHPPELIPSLLHEADRAGVTLVVASRYRRDGDATGQRGRTFLSRASTAAAKLAFPRALRALTDPMSGYFVVRREAIDVASLRPHGFKILVEIAVRTRGLTVAEVGYRFGHRFTGESKASLREGARYVRHLGRLRVDVVRRRSGAPPGARRRATHCYDIHGIVTVESDGRLPELEHFRVGRLEDPPTIRVHIGNLPPEPPPSRSRDRFRRRLRYVERLGSRGFGAEIELGEQIDVLATRLLRHSPHVLYTNIVEPILRWTFVERGYALVHGACVVRDGDAFMVTARTDTGKTTTMLKLLDDQPFEFMADDLTLVCPDGRVLSYPKPLTISRHTLHAVKTPLLTRRERATLGIQSRLHSRSGRRIAFLLARTGLPVATVNTLVQLLVPPPKYPVQRLVPGVAMAREARLAGLFVIQRGRDGFEWLEEADALEILLGNCEDAYGFPPYHAIEDFLLQCTGTDLRAVERQIIGGALEGRPAALLSSNALDWATRIPPFIDAIADEQATLRAVVDVDLSTASTGSSDGNGEVPAAVGGVDRAEWWPTTVGQVSENGSATESEPAAPSPKLPDSTIGRA